MMLCPLNVVLELSRFVNVTFSVNIGGEYFKAQYFSILLACCLFTNQLTGFSGPYIAGGQGGQLPPPGKLFFFSNIVFDFVGLFLLAILFRNLKKTD